MRMPCWRFSPGLTGVKARHEGREDDKNGGRGSHDGFTFMTLVSGSIYRLSTLRQDSREEQLHDR